MNPEQITNEQIRKKLITKEDRIRSGMPSDKYKSGTLVDTGESYIETIEKEVESKMSNEEELAKIRKEIMDDNNLGSSPMYKGPDQELYKSGRNIVKEYNKKQYN
ncbi:MAG: hypothetical protein MUF50_04045 [Planctomycetes bacterium]|jgi:hypothetical protein|nr:hypothetical protein [Planctomycetota bacterium]